MSTDFDVLGKLYFEELTIERILEIIDKERPRGVVLSFGGQTPNTTPRGFSLSMMSRILSMVSSSKYSLSRTSKSVDTVSGLQLTIITCCSGFRSASPMLTQHQSNSTLDPMR